MKYSKEFIELVNDSKWHGHYVGIGNPNAKVLIVGKECALDEKRDRLLYEETFSQNQEDWKRNVQEGVGFFISQPYFCISNSTSSVERHSI